MSYKRCSVVAALAVLLLAAPVFGDGPSFIPDAKFTGSNLNGWHTLGQAMWRAQNGEIIGTAGQGGGWLVLDHSFQDTGFYAQFRCATGCETGVLLRAEKTANGMKGIYLSLSGDDPAGFQVTLDAQGKELSREPLHRAGGQVRIAPPYDPAAEARAEAFRRRFAGRPPVEGPPGVTLPLGPPDRGLVPNEWNQLEIALDANILRGFINDGGASVGGIAEDEAGRYGPLALYIGGSGEVRFKDIAWKDLGAKFMPSEQISSNFRMQPINDLFYSWSAAAADVNRDGVLDVIAGPYYYLGPDYTTSHEIYLGQTVKASTEYPSDNWVAHAADFTGDGWPDVLATSHSGGEAGGAFLYVNPQKELRRWDKYHVVPTVRTEETVVRDVDGDGKLELVYAADGYIRLANPDPANPTGEWIVRSVSEKGPWTAHGIGVGDVNGDGRADVLNAWGWFEQPASAGEKTWTYHPEKFGVWTRGSPGGSQMAVYDVNGDGLNDIVTSLQAHGWGISWFEQKRGSDGKISFVEHPVMGNHSSKLAGGVSFSQVHGTTAADMDGDGLTDFVAGKRFWSHLDDFYDPDPYGPPVLYVFKTVRNPNAPGGAEFVPELIHNRSGVGSDVLAVDLNKDGIVDIVTTTNRGTFIFWGKPRTGGGAASTTSSARN